MVLVAALLVGMGVVGVPRLSAQTGTTTTTVPTTTTINTSTATTTTVMPVLGSAFNPDGRAPCYYVPGLVLPVSRCPGLQLYGSGAVNSEGALTAGFGVAVPGSIAGNSYLAVIRMPVTASDQDAHLVAQLGGCNNGQSGELLGLRNYGGQIQTLRIDCDSGNYAFHGVSSVVGFGPPTEFRVIQITLPQGSGVANKIYVDGVDAGISFESIPGLAFDCCYPGPYGVSYLALSSGPPNFVQNINSLRYVAVLQGTTPLTPTQAAALAASANAGTPNTTTTTTSTTTTTTTTLVPVTDRYGSAVLADGPSAYWRLDEPAGSSSVADSSGSGFGGTVTGPLQFGVGGVLTGRSAASSAGSGRVETSFTQGSVTEYSVESWVKTSSGSGMVLVENRGSDTSQSLSLLVGYIAGPGEPTFALDTQNRLLGVKGPAIHDGKWHHVVGTWSAASGATVQASQFHLYVDGVSVGVPIEVCYSPCNLPSPLHGDGGTTLFRRDVNPFVGDLDEVAVYRKLLTPAQVQAHYSARSPGTSVPAQPMVHVLGVAFTAPSPIKVAAKPVLAADPVNSATGAFTHEVSDLAVSSVGEQFSFSRLYDSTVTGSGVLGPMWGSPVFESVIPGTAQAGSVVWRSGTGGEVTYLSDGAGGFVSPNGTIGVLKAIPAGGWQYLSVEQSVSTFDAAGRIVGKVDRSGKGLTYTYDATGKLITVTDASGQITSLAYGTTASNPNFGLLIKITTADARVVKYGYAAGIAGKTRITSFTDLRGKITTYTYDAQGFLSSESDPVGNHPFVNVYDSQGRVLSQADPLGKISTFTYGAVDQVMTMVDAAGASHTYNYANNVLGSLGNPNGSSAMVRNAALDVTGYTDENGTQWTADYDTRGNMTKRTGPTGLIESWTYDLQNNPLTTTDTTGVTTAYVYDGNGRVSSESKAGTTKSWVWNPDGTVASSTDALGRVTTYTYDGAGHRTSELKPSGAKLRGLMTRLGGCCRWFLLGAMLWVLIRCSLIPSTVMTRRVT